MNAFNLWFVTGLQHITDINGYDHILFVVLLTLPYSFTNLKQLVWLITAFTLGHSITLALSVLDIMYVKASVVEFFIALTILLTALYRFVNVNNPQKSKFWVFFTLVVLFGFIHGMGFSYLLKSMLGKEENILFPLLYFNLGLEAGQLLIVLTVLLIHVLLSRFNNLTLFYYYKIAAVGLITLVALKWCIERFMALF